MSLDDIVLLFSPFYILIIHFTRCIYRDWYHYLFSVLCSATFHLLVVCAFVTFFNKYLVSCILTFMNLFSLVLCSFTYKTRQNARQFHSFTFSINATASNCILYGGELSKWQIVLEWNVLGAHWQSGETSTCHQRSPRPVVIMNSIRPSSEVWALINQVSNMFFCTVCDCLICNCRYTGRSWVRWRSAFRWSSDTPALHQWWSSAGSYCCWCCISHWAW